MANVAFNDLSGTSTPITANPYDGLIQACNNNPTQIQARYQTHRTTRNSQQHAKILSSDGSFTAWSLDPILTLLSPSSPTHDPAFTDPRHCLVFWARPPPPVRALIEQVQQRLQGVVPGIWLMPGANLHMTAMEVTHSRTEGEIEALVRVVGEEGKKIADLELGGDGDEDGKDSHGQINPTSKRKRSARLVKPMVSFDAAALALSFVPAGDESGDADSTHQSRRQLDSDGDDSFTYHHLRRELYAAITTAGVPVASRYVVPSAHLTIARFNSANPFSVDTPLDSIAGMNLENREKLMREIEDINVWLEKEYWPSSVTSGQESEIRTIKEGGQWVVGGHQGLDFRKGRLWYGGGETVYLGEGMPGTNSMT